MKSKYRVMTKNVAGTDFYQVYRLKEICSATEPKNMETVGGLYITEKEAIDLAELLNEEVRRGKE